MTSASWLKWQALQRLYRKVAQGCVITHMHEESSEARYETLVAMYTQGAYEGHVGIALGIVRGSTPETNCYHSFFIYVMY